MWGFESLLPCQGLGERKREKKVAQAARVVEPGDSGSGGPSQGMSRPAWLARLTEWPQQAKKFLHDVRVEMGHVTWPALVEVRSTTFIVIVTIFFFGAFFFVVDLGVSKVVELILKRGKL